MRPNSCHATRTYQQTTTINLEPHQIIVRPLVTEKGMHRSTRNNAYAFEVHRLATKTDVRRAVEELFNVTVLAVHTQNRKGKPRRTQVPLGHDRQLEEGDRDVGQRTQDRFLLGEAVSCQLSAVSQTDWLKADS